MKELLENKKSESKRFSIVKRAKSFIHAGRGIYIFIKTTHNSWIHILILGSAIVLGFYFDINNTDWIFLSMAGGFVLASEAFNTAIEIDMDLTSPEYHPYARDTKDVSAGAVLISATTALIVGILIFGKYLLGFV
jgi:diacylglycerol kinase